MLTQQGKRLAGTALLCAGGAVLLLHPFSLLAFGVGAWAGYRGRAWLGPFLGGGPERPGSSIRL